MKVPQADIDFCLKVEASVKPHEKSFFDECMNGVSLSTRIKSPRSDRDVYDGCILMGVFIRGRTNK